MGCLGIGAPGNINQSFDNYYGPDINTSLIPGYMWEHNTTASNSFSMHIGSANPRMPGSFYFGGYDQNRVVGDILTYSDGYTKPIALRDIGIRVIDGSSPWGFKSLGGLLASGNSSIASGGFEVSIDGCSPYLTLPKSTCDAIASHLPVKFNEDLGLYIWNVNDPKYTQIIRSASALEFVFIAESNTENVTIMVPFRHLNLTLTEPLVQEATQYFPCYTGPSGSPTLGRAFLQDAFVGANWGTNSWWLAQAPGPNIPSSSIIELGAEDSIKASANDWEESWSRAWTVLTPDEVDNPTNSSALNATEHSTPTDDALSTGAKAGIGVGVGIASITAIGALAFFFLRRRKSAPSKRPMSDMPHSTPDQGLYAFNRDQTSPGMTDVSTDVSRETPNAVIYSHQNPQEPGQQYVQPVQPYQQNPHPYGRLYGAELPTDNNRPTELPGTMAYDPLFRNST
ncbi:hypothetical protein M426DRAFT_323259 [Hypoxylon sp. CI-4A]|nr:hypothetical protein M426DRAFT_323259 [Hypoxylon sp. CI-4A]